MFVGILGVLTVVCTPYCIHQMLRSLYLTFLFDVSLCRYNDRPHSGKDNYERGGYAGRGGSRSRGGYRGSRDFPPRKWDRNDDSRNSKGSEDNDVKKLEKPKTKV